MAFQTAPWDMKERRCKGAGELQVSVKHGSCEGQHGTGIGGKNSISEKAMICLAQIPATRGLEDLCMCRTM